MSENNVEDELVGMKTRVHILEKKMIDIET